MLGQFPWRHLVCVVDAAGDDGVVGVAVQKVHDDFLPDAGCEDAAVARTSPGVGYADPAAGVFVHGTDAVPVELHLHAAILVGPYFLAGWPNDYRRLRAKAAGLGRDAGRGKGQAGGLGLQHKALDGADLFLGGFGRGLGHAADLGVLLKVVLHRRDEVLLVLVAAGVVFQVEGVAGRQRAAAGLALHRALAGEVFLQPHPHIGFAVAIFGVTVVIRMMSRVATNSHPIVFP